jgi:hypothetical protein
VVGIEEVGAVLLELCADWFVMFLTRGVNMEMITTVIVARTKARLSREADVFTALLYVQF